MEQGHRPVSVVPRTRSRWHVMAPIILAFGFVGYPGIGFSLLAYGLSPEIVFAFARPAILLSGAAFFSLRMADVPRAPRLSALSGLAGALLWNTDGGGLFSVAPLAVLLIATRPYYRSTWLMRALLGLVGAGFASALLTVLPPYARGVAAIIVAAGTALGIWIADRTEGTRDHEDAGRFGAPQPERSSGRIGTGIASGVAGAAAGFALGWAILFTMAVISWASAEPETQDLGLAALAIIVWPAVVGAIVGVSLTPAILRRPRRRQVTTR